MRPDCMSMTMSFTLPTRSFWVLRTSLPIISLALLASVTSLRSSFCEIFNCSFEASVPGCTSCRRSVDLGSASRRVLAGLDCGEDCAKATAAVESAIASVREAGIVFMFMWVGDEPNATTAAREVSPSGPIAGSCPIGTRGVRTEAVRPGDFLADYHRETAPYRRDEVFIRIQPMLKLLVIEDDEADYHFIEMALKETRFATRVRWVTDGELAIDYLSGRGPHADRAKFPVPDVVVLDLKMPRVGGFELLQWMRAHPDYRDTPALVMSSSGLPQDVARAYQLRANSYFVKPGRFEDFVELFQLIAGYWSFARTPAQAHAHS
ncbi:MAG: hypothetical protein C0518_01675 [Opitutus sp.]|nr:hypothetical protein [Opitutus sp.]